MLTRRNFHILLVLLALSAGAVAASRNAGGQQYGRDDREAARLYKLAADQGNAQAQANLGTFYLDGRGGLPKDDREAIVQAYGRVDPLDLAAAQLVLAVQWLGWCEGWRPPREHSHDWLAEARSAAEVLA